MPSHHKRHTPARAANGPIATEAVAPAETNPESSSAAQSTPTPEAPPPQPQGQAQQSAPPPPAPPPQPPQQQQQQQRRAQGLNITDLKDMSIQKLTQIAKDLT